VRSGRRAVDAAQQQEGPQRKTGDRQSLSSSPRKTATTRTTAAAQHNRRSHLALPGRALLRAASRAPASGTDASIKERFSNNTQAKNGMVKREITWQHNFGFEFTISGRQQLTQTTARHAGLEQKSESHPHGFRSTKAKPTVTEQQSSRLTDLLVVLARELEREDHRVQRPA
jgi:hypothetical protein